MCEYDEILSNKNGRTGVLDTKRWFLYTIAMVIVTRRHDRFLIFFKQGACNYNTVHTIIRWPEWLRMRSKSAQVHTLPEVQNIQPHSIIYPGALQLLRNKSQHVLIGLWQPESSGCKKTHAEYYRHSSGGRLSVRSL